MKALYVVDVCPQVMHVSRLRSCPWNVSTITLSLRLRYMLHSATLASCCGRRSNSACCASPSSMGGGRCTTRFRSSCRPSSRNVRNSWLSCCSELRNAGAKRPIASRNAIGETNRYCSDQSVRSSCANASASTPRVPSGFCRLIARRYDPSSMKRASGTVAFRHCSVAFM